MAPLHSIVAASTNLSAESAPNWHVVHNDIGSWGAAAFLSPLSFRHLFIEINLVPIGEKVEDVTARPMVITKTFCMLSDPRTFLKPTFSQ